MMPTSTSKKSPQQHFIQGLAVRSLTAKNYRKTLNGFQRFLAEQGVDKSVSQETLRRWLEDRSRVWPFVKLAPRARLVDRFLEWMAEKGTLANNPFAELRKEYGQQSTAPIARALLSPNFADALEALRPAPRFGSFLGSVMRDHVALMQTLGYRYDTQEERLLRLDRFLQRKPELTGQSLTVLIAEWANTRSGPQQAFDCHLAGRILTAAPARIDPTNDKVPWEKRIRQEAHQRHRQPYIFSEQEIQCLAETALRLPCPSQSLRPRTAQMMILLGYCAGLRIGEIVRLNMGDFEAEEPVIQIRGTKFFKSRRLPLSDSVYLRA